MLSIAVCREFAAFDVFSIVWNRCLHDCVVFAFPFFFFSSLVIKFICQLAVTMSICFTLPSRIVTPYLFSLHLSVLLVDDRLRHPSSLTLCLMVAVLLPLFPWKTEKDKVWVKRVTREYPLLSREAIYPKKLRDKARERGRSRFENLRMENGRDEEKQRETMSDRPF